MKHDHIHPHPPNIVFILSDDQGAWALGCAGNPDIRTPNLDRLAGEGIRFSNFFCTSPVCSPARASLLTGYMPSRHGVHDWIRGGNAGGQPIEYLAGQTAYTELLQENGYRLGLSGKWHLGHSLKPQKGFDHWYVHREGGGPYYGAPMVRDGGIVEEPGYLTEAITEEALRFLDCQDGSSPFYLGVHYTAPHSPWIDSHPPEWVQLYDDCAFASCPQEPRHPWSIPTAPWSDCPQDNLKGYFAAVSAMDAQIGRIIHRLERSGLRENTLVVFLSDNGFNCGHHGIWGKGNGTFPFNMYDTSVKVPAIFSHPGRIPQGQVCGELLSGYDLMPTLLEYAGIPCPDAGSRPGRSFGNLLRGEEREGREEVVVYDEYGPVRMIRSREWKYVHRYPYGPHELYHLESDPGERRNRLDDPQAAEMLAQLRNRLGQWFVRHADPAVDGTREPVSGFGQTRLAGLAGDGREAYCPPPIQQRQ